MSAGDGFNFIGGCAVFAALCYWWVKSMTRKPKRPEPIPGAICPICKNETVVPIKASSKAASVAAFGVFAAGSVSKTLRCLHCNARF